MTKISVSVVGCEDVVGEGVVDYTTRIVKVKVADYENEKEYVYPFEAILCFRFLTYDEYKNKIQ